MEANLGAGELERTGEVARPLPVSRAVAVPPQTYAQRARSFLRRVYDKAGDDNIFFLAGAISFNLIVAIVPLLLFAVGVASIFLSARFGDPAAAVLDLILDYVPAVGGDVNLVQSVRGAIQGLIAGRTGFTAVGAFLLVWFSTRLVGTLRSVLQEVFDVAQDRGIIGGKIFDIKAVVIGGALMLVNLGITTEMETLRNIGITELRVTGEALSLLQLGWRLAVSYFSAWVLFLGLYRFLPARWIPWKTAIVAATFTATLFEGLKYAFSWYVTQVADYGSTYGNLISAAVLFFWIYYGSIVFILGGEVAQVWTMRRALRSTRAGTLFKDIV